jgi:hypothetical protein
MEFLRDDGCMLVFGRVGQATPEGSDLIRLRDKAETQEGSVCLFVRILNGLGLLGTSILASC